MTALRLPGIPSRLFLLALGLILQLSSFTLPVEAGWNRNAGTTGAQFLRVAVTPRAAALGEAYGALGDDAEAMLYNPAGLHYLSRKEAQFVHAELFADIRLNSLFYAHPLADPLGTIGVNYTFLDYGSIQRTILNAPGAVNPFSTTGTFSAYDHALTLAYADEVSWWGRKFRWGLAAKVVQQVIGAESANGLLYDAGVLHTLPGSRVRLGAAIQNVGFLSKFRDEADPVPINLKLSAARPFYDDRLRLAADLNLPIDNAAVLNLGAEVLPLPQLALRAGYRWDNDNSDFTGYSLGMGVTLAGVSVDYAYVPFELLGGNHRFSISSQFGPAVRQPEEIGLPVRRPARATPPSPAYASTPVSATTSSTATTGATASGNRGVHADPFLQTAGGPEHAWIGPATAQVFQKGWQRRGVLNPTSPLVVNGEYTVIGSKLIVTARVMAYGRVFGTFESEGDVAEPFPVWGRVAEAVNGRLASLGIR